MSINEMKDVGFARNSDIDGFKLKQLRLLVYQYSLLCRLRQDELAAWDTINELYEDE